MSNSSTRPCEFLPWDSEFFRIRIARVQGDQLDADRALTIAEWARLNRIQCLYFLARADDPQTVQSARTEGFELVDIRMTLQRQGLAEMAKSAGQPGSLTVIRSFRPEDLAVLQTLARHLHRDTRFFSDRGFSRNRCEDLYSLWISLECQGRADRVFVADWSTNGPQGYISCHLNREHRTGQIGLVAVGTESRGRGVGRALVSAALDWFAVEGAREVIVVTQGRNISAQRLYQRCGFATQQVQLWYHKWFTTVCKSTPALERAGTNDSRYLDPV